MKLKSIFLALVLCISSSALLAQANSIKLNAFSSIIGDYSVGLERGIGNNISLGLWGSLRPFTLLNNNNDDVTLKRYTIMPEARYYVQEDGTYTGFFVGLYAKYNMFRANFEDLVVDIREEDGYLVAQEFRDVSVSIDRIPVGILTGYKTITDGGFTFEINGGIGRAVYRKIDIDIPDYEEETSEADLSVIPSYGIDIRFGVVVGYSF